MKHLFSLVFVAASAALFGQNIPSYVPTNGLVAWYPFNGNANDESGNGNNGTVNGATLTTDRDGNANSAYYFSGSGCATRIDINANTSSINSGITISTWLSRTGNGCIGPRIFEAWGGSNSQGHIQFGWDNSSSNPIGITHRVSGNAGPSLAQISAPQAVPNNSWTLYTYTNDGITASLYQDGVLRYQGTNPSGSVISMANDWAIGRMNHSAWDAFNGKIDDFGVWNRALSPSEIQSLYTGTVNYNPDSAYVNNRGCIVCDQYAAGDTFSLDNGATWYTAVDRPLLETMRDNGDDLSKVCVSLVSDMSTLFQNKNSFNDDISSWDVSNVTNMSYMFTYAFGFDQDISNWDVKIVTNMRNMFQYAFVFNQDIGGWDVRNVANMRFMFNGAGGFNQDLSQWCVNLIPATPNGFSTGSALTSANMPVWGSCPSIPLVYNPNNAYINGRGCLVCDNYTAGDNFSLDSGATWYTAVNRNLLLQKRDNGDDLSKVCVSLVSDMDSALTYIPSFNDDISGWDVSNVTDMRHMFTEATSFNQDISNWDMDSVVSTMSMFYNASSFNQDLNGWDLRADTSVAGMFRGATSFNGNIGAWDMASSVTDASGMFRDATSFNQDISSWDMSNITNMRAMFQGATAFAQDITSWDVSSVTSMARMFRSHPTFNQDLSGWDISSLEDINSMFWGASSFNQDLGSWDVGSITNMSNAFREASAFNQDLSRWDVSSVTAMSGMFRNASSFSQDLSLWCVPQFSFEPSGFSQNSGLTATQLPVWGSCPDLNPNNAYLNSRGCLVCDQYAAGDWFSLDSGATWNRAVDKTMLIQMRDNGDDLSKVCVSLITNMDSALAYVPGFNQDISSWDVSNVTSMFNMFAGATSFDGSIGNWDMDSVENTLGMFYLASAFNQDISSWDMGSDTTMAAMFRDAINFNQDISAWDVSSVHDLTTMFRGASSFNGSMPNWDVGSVRKMAGVFRDAVVFNGDISNWNTSAVTTMNGMFQGASSFNEDISAWDVSSVENMTLMFKDATSFNGDLSAWYTASATNMTRMFNGATNFNQDLSGWCVGNITTPPSNFSTGSALTSANMPVWGTCFCPSYISFVQDTVALCGVGSYSIDAGSGFSSYLWSTGDSTQSITVSNSGLYSCTVSDNGCFSTDSLYVSLLDASITASDSVVCAGDSVNLQMRIDSSFLVSTSLPSYLPTDSLVAYFNFDNGSVNDLSGNGSTLQNFGGHFTTDENGVANNAISFDGLSQYARITLSENLVDDFTIFLRVYNTPNNDANYDRLIGFESYNLELAKSGSNLSFYSNSCGWNSLNGGVAQYSWHDVVLSKSGSQVYVFINESLTDSLSCSANFFGDDLDLGRALGCCEYAAFRISELVFFNKGIRALKGSNSVGSIYQWSTGDTTASITANPTQTTTYYCTVSDGISTCTDSVTVYVNSLPLLDLGSDTLSVCGSSHTLDAGAGFSSYLWSTGDSTQTATISSSGMYSCTVGDNGCFSTDSLYVSLLDASITASDSVVCAGDSVSLNIPDIALSDSTLIDDNTINFLRNTANQTLNYSTPVLEVGKTYLISVGGSVKYNCCGYFYDARYYWSNGGNRWWGNPNQETQVHYRITNNLGLSYTPSVWRNSHEYYLKVEGQGQPIGFNSTGVYEGSLSFKVWEFNSEVQFNWSTGDTTASITANPTQTTTYYCTVSDGISTCTDSVTVYVNSPMVDLGADTLSVCGQDSVLLDAGAGHSSYLWNTGETTQTIYADASGTYSVEVSDGTPSSNSSSLSFDGVDDFVEVSNSSIVDNTDELTINIWFKPSVLSSNVLVGKWSDPGSSTNRPFILELDAVNNRIQFIVNGGAGFIDMSASVVTLNQWNYISCVYDGVNNMMRLYHDGQLISQTSISSGGLLMMGTNKMNIGTHNNVRNFTEGFLDDIHIWNTALTQSEIQQYMSCPPTGNEAGLVGYWNFEEGTGSVANDLSGNGNHGTINGATWSSDVPSQSCGLGCTATDSVYVSLVDASITASDSVVCAGDSVVLLVDSTENTALNNLPSYLPSADLIAHFDFGNASLSDISGNGNSFQNFGGQFTADENGNANSAIQYDGISQFSKISLIDSVGAEFSMFLRLYNPVNSDPFLDRIFGFDNYNFELAKSGGQLKFYSHSGGWYDVSYNLPFSTWVDMYIKVEANWVYFYFDGVLTDSTSITSTDFGQYVFLSNAFTSSEHSPFTLSQFLLFDGSQQGINLTPTTYTWSTGDTTASISANPTQTTTYYCTVSNGISTCTDSVTVYVQSLPVIDLGPDSIASCDSLVLDAGAGFDSYLWNTGETSQTISANQSGAYWAMVSQNGCSATDSVYVGILDASIRAASSCVSVGDSITLTAGSTSSNLPAYLPTNGLVAWYPFNGNANDESGNGNNGTVNGATLTTDRNGHANSAYDFDGSDYVSVSDDSTLSWGSSNYSVAAWINNSDLTSNYQTFIAKAEASPNYTGWFLGLASSDLRFYSGSTYNGTWLNNGNINSDFTISENQWYFITGVFEGVSGQTKLYVNGQLYQTVNATISVNPDNVEDLKIGAYMPSGAPSGPEFFYGKIDDIAIYNRALSASEIQSLYSANTSNLTYNWSTGDSTQSITVSPTQATTYSCTISDGTLSCTDSVTIDVAAGPSIDSVVAINANQGVYMAYFNSFAGGLNRLEYKGVDETTWKVKYISYGGGLAGYQKFNIIPRFNTQVEVRLASFNAGLFDEGCPYIIDVPCKNMILQMAEQKSAFCAGDSALVRVGIAGGYGTKSIMWSNGATTKRTYAQQGETLYVTVTDATGCSLTDSITGSVLSAGTAPTNLVVTRSGALITGTWNASVLGSNQTLIGYRMAYRLRGTQTWTNTPLTSNTTYTMNWTGSGIPAGNYEFVVFARYRENGVATNSNFSCITVKGYNGVGGKSEGADSAEPTDVPNISVYPNPTDNILYVQTPENSSLMLVDMNGKTLTQLTTEAVETSIDVSSYAQGVYMLQIQTGEAVETRRIVRN